MPEDTGLFLETALWKSDPFWAAMVQVSGFGCQGVEVLDPETCTRTPETIN